MSAKSTKQEEEKLLAFGRDVMLPFFVGCSVGTLCCLFVFREFERDVMLPFFVGCSVRTLCCLLVFRALERDVMLPDCSFNIGFRP